MRVVHMGSDRYRPLPLQTPDRVRAKRSGVTLPLHYRERKGVGNIASTDATDPLCASPAVQYNPPRLYGKAEDSSIYQSEEVSPYVTALSNVQ